MKTWQYILAALLFVAVVGAGIYGLRLFTNVTTPITVHQVQPGISCAVITTTDSAAISCWKD